MESKYLIFGQNICGVWDGVFCIGDGVFEFGMVYFGSCIFFWNDVFGICKVNFVLFVFPLKTFRNLRQLLLWQIWGMTPSSRCIQVAKRWCNNGSVQWLSSASGELGWFNSCKILLIAETSTGKKPWCICSTRICSFEWYYMQSHTGCTSWTFLLICLLKTVRHINLQYWLLWA